jgi:glycyl-tRNA synthetase
MENVFDKVVALSKRRGFIYPGSELYGGLANTYDYGPMGVELMRNIRNLWWDTFVHKKNDMVGLEASLISHQEIWKASGHVGSFADALIDCKNCKTRMRADHLIENYLEEKNEMLSSSSFGDLYDEVSKKYVGQQKVEGMPEKYMDEIVRFHKIPCPKCKENKGDKWTPIRKFNLLFPVQMGIVEGDQSLAYLRGETAQGMFVAFKNILDSTRLKLPFGVAQVGKSFRNEITPGNSVFRTLVFEQAEIEYFFDPEKNDWQNLYEDWKAQLQNFVEKKLGIRSENLRWRIHTDEERSFYSKRTEDLEYHYSFGFKELWGLAYRTDYDLSQHQKFSGKDLKIVDSQTGEKVLPHVIEPAVGIDRLFLMVLCDAYFEDESRVVLKIAPRLAPIKAAVFPLLANKEELTHKAEELHAMLQAEIQGRIAYDPRGNIGKRYLSQDEVGTPFCITVDFQTLEDDTVTVRERDTATQTRIKIKELHSYLHQKLT